MHPREEDEKDSTSRLDFDALNRAIEVAKASLRLFTIAPPIVKRGAKGETHVDVPVMYMDFAIDRIHYDPLSKTPSPKGRPVKTYAKINPEDVRNRIEEVLEESYIIEAAEFREVEKAWVIPLAWRKLIIMHVKVSYDGESLIPDYGLTKELRKRV